MVSEAEKEEKEIRTLREELSELFCRSTCRKNGLPPLRIRIYNRRTENAAGR